MSDEQLPIREFDRRGNMIGKTDQEIRDHMAMMRAKKKPKPPQGGSLANVKGRNLTPCDLPAHRPWDRLPKETSQAYSAFSTFLSYGTGRTIPLAWRTLPDPKPRRAPGRWYRWFKRWRWTDRVDAYENYQRLQVERHQIDDRMDAKRKRKRALEALMTSGLRGLQKFNDACRDNRGADAATKLLRAASYAIGLAVEQSRKEFDDEPIQRVEVEARSLSINLDKQALEDLGARTLVDVYQQIHEEEKKPT